MPTSVGFVGAQSLRVVQVAAGNEHTALLTDQGDVYTCGYNDSGQGGIGSTGRVPSLRLVEALRGRADASKRERRDAALGLDSGAARDRRVFEIALCRRPKYGDASAWGSCC